MEASSRSQSRARVKSPQKTSSSHAKAPAKAAENSQSGGEYSDGTKKFIKNEKMLILDFSDSTLTPEKKIRLIRDCILQKTELIDFRIKILERGGVSILFKTMEQKKFAESILKKEFESILSKKGYISSKKTFEVLLPKFPQELDLEALMSIENITSFKQLKSTDVVLFMNSKESAAKLIQSGLFLEKYYFSISPFVFRPHILCGLCRKIGHNQMSCTNRPKSSSLCMNCAKDHAALSVVPRIPHSASSQSPISLLEYHRGCRYVKAAGSPSPCSFS